MSSEEIVVMARLGAKSGSIQKDELKVIKNILAAQEKPVRDIMTPRSVIFSLDSAMTIENASQQQGLYMHSRVPVYVAGSDDIVGLVYRRDILSAISNGNQHLFASIFVAFLTVVATKNIPGILELTILQRLKFAAGERYAITSIVRYIIVGVSVVLTFNAVGIGWSKVQWLIAALSLGLGFGLQEIFANFVSGIIILFERPIRIGDTVTVGGVHGTVTRIRIRATTITDFNRKELVVPNKEFITAQLVNWTLSDPLLRVIIPVGVSYDADVELTSKTLLEIADANAMVLKDPEPQGFFLGFGDSTLNFELRVHCYGIDDFVPVKHHLHMEIIKAFREKGIEISYPQRDLHIRSSDVPFIQQKENT